MAEINVPLAVELALVGLANDTVDEQRQAAIGSGIPAESFDRVVRGVKLLPSLPETENQFIQFLYLLDGWAKGYGVFLKDGLESAHVAGQRADTYYKGA